MDNQEIEDAVIVEDDATVKEKPAKLSVMGMLAALSSAMSTGDITSHQAREMRGNLGITQAYFTRKQPSKAKIKTNRKLQKMARKAQRGK